jgi:hypothetical protein
MASARRLNLPGDVLFGVSGGEQQQRSDHDPPHLLLDQRIDGLADAG